jgi:hypothetical protein
MEVERKIIADTLQLTDGQIASFGFAILFARSFGIQTLGVH